MEFLSDQDAKLVTLVPENEETFYVRTTYSPESADDTIKKSFTRYFAPGAGTFSTFGKLTAALGVVKTEEIKISDSILVFSLIGVSKAYTLADTKEYIAINFSWKMTWNL